MIEIGRVAGALVERVADHAALRRPRCHVEHQLVAAPDQLVVERLVAHARLDHGEGELLVDLEDAVHPAAEIDHHLARARRGARAETDIVAGADRIERHIMRVRRPHDRLHVGGGGRVDHAGRRPVAARHGVLAITPDRLLGAIDAVGAERAGDLGEERFESRVVMNCPPACVRSPDAGWFWSAASGALWLRCRGGARARAAQTPCERGRQSARRSPSPAVRPCARPDARDSGAICTMQPILPAAMMSGSTLCDVAALRWPSAAAISGCSRL